MRPLRSRAHTAQDSVRHRAASEHGNRAVEGSQQAIWRGRRVSIARSCSPSCFFFFGNLEPLAVHASGHGVRGARCHGLAGPLDGIHFLKRCSLRASHVPGARRRTPPRDAAGALRGTGAPCCSASHRAAQPGGDGRTRHRVLCGQARLRPPGHAHARTRVRSPAAGGGRRR